MNLICRYKTEVNIHAKIASHGNHCQMQTQTAAVYAVGRGRQLFFNGAGKPPVNRYKLIRQDLGNIKTCISKMLIVFRSSKFVARSAKDVDQISRNLAIHRNTFCYIINNGYSRKLECFKSRNFVDFSVFSRKVSINVHTILA